MRKNVVLVALAMLGLGWASPVVLRADGPATAPAAQQNRPRQGPGVQREFVMLQTALDGLNLTDDQKSKVHTIIDAARDKATAWRDANKDTLEQLRKDMKAAQESGDQTKIDAVKAKLQALYKDASHGKETLEQIKAVLTPEQQEKLQAKFQEYRKEHAGGLRVPTRIQNVLEGLDLSADQKTRVQAILNTAKEQYKADPKSAPKPQELIQQIKAVLTPEQLAKLDAKVKAFENHRPGSGAGGPGVPSGATQPTPPGQ